MNHLLHFFRRPDESINLVQGTYQPELVLLSVLVAVVLSLLALFMAESAQRTSSRS